MPLCHCPCCPQNNVEAQLNRLLTQLQDIEDMREELDDAEYNEMRADTLTQLEEFNKSLESMKSGDTTLVNDYHAVQLAIEATIKSKCKTPEVIRMFARREPDALRSRLAQLQSDLKLQRLKQDAFNQQAVEIVNALQKMGETLTREEQAVLQASNSTSMEAVGDAHVGAEAEASIAGIAAAAASDVTGAR